MADGRGQGIVVARKAQDRALRLEGQPQLAARGDDEFRFGCQLLQRVGREHTVFVRRADLRAVQEDLDIRGGLTLDVIDGDGAGSADQCGPMEME